MVFAELRFCRPSTIAEAPPLLLGQLFLASVTTLSSANMLFLLVSVNQKFLAQVDCY